MSQKIQVKKTKIDNRFILSWQNRNDNSLVLDFNPFIDYYVLKGHFRLLHWQARPKTIRTWGLYDSKDKSYSCISEEFYALSLPSTNLILLQLDENLIQTVPTAVLLLT